jgi:hypothetical protein
VFSKRSSSVGFSVDVSDNENDPYSEDELNISKDASQRQSVVVTNSSQGNTSNEEFSNNIYTNTTFNNDMNRLKDLSQSIASVNTMTHSSTSSSSVTNSLTVSPTTRRNTLLNMGSLMKTPTVTPLNKPRQEPPLRPQSQILTTPSQRAQYQQQHQSQLLEQSQSQSQSQSQQPFFDLEKKNNNNNEMKVDADDDLDDGDLDVSFDFTDTVAPTKNPTRNSVNGNTAHLKTMNISDKLNGSLLNISNISLTGNKVSTLEQKMNDPPRTIVPSGVISTTSSETPRPNFMPVPNFTNALPTATPINKNNASTNNSVVQKQPIQNEVPNSQTKNVTFKNNDTAKATTSEPMTAKNPTQRSVVNNTSGSSFDPDGSLSIATGDLSVLLRSNITQNVEIVKEGTRVPKVTPNLSFVSLPTPTLPCVYSPGTNGTTSTVCDYVVLCVLCSFVKKPLKSMVKIVC